MTDRTEDFLSSFEIRRKDRLGLLKTQAVHSMKPSRVADASAPVHLDDSADGTLVDRL